MMGGFGVGILTTGIIVGMRKLGLSAWWVDSTNRICSSTMCTVMAQPITWPSVLAIGVEPYRWSNHSSGSWFYIGESLNQPS